MLTQYNAWTLTGVLEEKSSRVVEVLLAAIRPAQLLAGKVLGYAFYSWVYAAAGAIGERQDQVQSLVFPLNLPVIFGYVIPEGHSPHRPPGPPPRGSLSYLSKAVRNADGCCGQAGHNGGIAADRPDVTCVNTIGISIRRCG
jgi:hypothetical protein